MPHTREDAPAESLWTPIEAADYLGVPRQTIYKWRVTGDGPPGYRVGRHLRFDPAEVRDWVRTHGNSS